MDDDCEQDQEEIRLQSTRSSQEPDRAKGYLVIDHGEKIKADFKFSQDQIQRQIEHLHREMELLFEIVRDLMLLMGPLVVGWLCFFVSRMLFSRMMESMFVCFNSFLMSSCLLLFMTPLTEAVVRLMNALEEFKELKDTNEQEQFEDPVEESGDGDAGHTTEVGNLSMNASDAENLGNSQVYFDDVTDEPDENENESIS